MSCVLRADCTAESQFTPDRSTAVTTNSKSHAQGGTRLTKSPNSVPAATPNEARMGTRDIATAISAVEETNANALRR